MFTRAKRLLNSRADKRARYVRRRKSEPRISPIYFRLFSLLERSYGRSITRYTFDLRVCFRTFGIVMFVHRNVTQFVGLFPYNNTRVIYIHVCVCVTSYFVHTRVSFTNSNNISERPICLAIRDIFSLRVYSPPV